jgi:lipopolysaccharide/colanic/teichoic acid biosynthesis glycosyltransferase
VNPGQTSPGLPSGWPAPAGADTAAQLAPGLCKPGALFVKRVLDIAVAVLLLGPAIVFAAAIAVAIVVESRGPVLFAHIRIGRSNRRLRLWKFRTMVQDADAVLDEYLKAHPDLLAEWRETHKLKNDPRVTRVGRWLRRSSLDELPQLINVLRGEMSMVGPRPIVAEEVAKYGPVFALYSRVRPGLTGLWQVSGRTDTSYRARTALDLEYLRERTLGLDLLVLLKTIRVVLLGHGAY